MPQVLGISVDGAWCHVAFAKDRHLHFPLLADFEPKGEVSRKYGAYHDEQGESARALFVIDADGVIRWNHCRRRRESRRGRNSASARCPYAGGARRRQLQGAPHDRRRRIRRPDAAREREGSRAGTGQTRRSTLVEYGDYECSVLRRCVSDREAAAGGLGKAAAIRFPEFPAESRRIRTRSTPRCRRGGGSARRGDLLADARHVCTRTRTRSRTRTSRATQGRSAYPQASSPMHLREDRIAERVRADFRGGIRSGVNGTPTFFVNGERYDGNWTDVDSFASELRSAAKSHG